MIEAGAIVELHDGWNAAGHGDRKAVVQPKSSLEEIILLQHQANFDLWHEEDRARDPDAPPATIAAVKHSIDALNQSRNDLVEQIDAALYQAAAQNPTAVLHSETPGLIIDRLSIISLKIFHSREESRRQDASESHRQRNQERSDLLTEQRDDLAGALNELWRAVLAGERRFKLYKQMKMYNDPSLNPVLYRRAGTGHK